MKTRYQNIFFLFGLLLLSITVALLDFKQVWEGLKHAGYWFLAVIVLWALLYLFNVSTWYIILRSQDKTETQFRDTLAGSGAVDVGLQLVVHPARPLHLMTPVAAEFGTLVELVVPYQLVAVRRADLGHLG